MKARDTEHRTVYSKGEYTVVRSEAKRYDFEEDRTYGHAQVFYDVVLDENIVESFKTLKAAKAYIDEQEAEAGEENDPAHATDGNNMNMEGEHTMKIKEIDTITKSETKKAVRYFEKKHPGSSVIASGWSTHPQTEDDKVTGFQTVSVELWSEEERDSYTVYLAVCLWDRRKTFVMKDAENWYTEPTKEETATDNTENEEGESQKGKNTMKTKKTFEIEVMRHNVTPAQFLAYLRQMQKKHPEMSSDFDLDYFALRGYWSRYEQDSRYDCGTPDTKPCESEICKVKPYDHQTYIRNFDGTTYNEIIEFQFDDEKTGTGYYYTVQIDVEDEDRESNTRESLERIATYHENHAKRNREKAAKIRAYLAEHGEWLSESYKGNQNWEADHLEREAAEAEALAEECRDKAAPTAAQIVAAVTEKVEQTKTRSAWERGVKAYAEELVEELREAVEGGYIEASDLSNRRLFERAMLNGAADWRQYSEGGSYEEVINRVCHRIKYERDTL